MKFRYITIEREYGSGGTRIARKRSLYHVCHEPYADRRSGYADG